MTYKAQLSYPKSRCYGSWLHRYQIQEQYINAIKEVCTICGKSVYFKFTDEGKADNMEYIRHHMRNVLLRQHNLFKHEYNK